MQYQCNGLSYRQNNKCIITLVECARSNGCSSRGTGPRTVDRGVCFVTEVVLLCCFLFSQLTYLPPPWGDCKSTPMNSDFFSTYSLTACRIDCETRYLVENCNCRMVHMPGRHQGDALTAVFMCKGGLKCLHLRRTILEEQTSFLPRLQKMSYFHTPLDQKTQLFSRCVCAVITAGVCCLPSRFNHRVTSQKTNWKAVWHRGNIWIWPPLTLTHLSNSC